MKNMDYDKKPNVIKFEGSKIQYTQKLIDELRTTLGVSKYKWTTNLKNNITLTEVLEEITDALDGLDNKYGTSGCNGTHYGSVKNGKTSTYNGCSSNKSGVNSRNCNGGYDFSECGNCYNMKDE